MRRRRISQRGGGARLRSMRKLFLLMLLVAMPCLGDDCHPNWGYGPNNGPAHWGALGYRRCAAGTRQSPIDFKDLGRPDNTLSTVGLNDTVESTFKVERRAYDVEVKETNPLWTLTWSNRHATLEQFHFHVHAEHYLNGKQHDAEIHFVFKETGRNARIVIAVWIERGTENEALKEIIKLKPPDGCPHERSSGAIKIKMGDLLRNVNHYATYEGSLTTPECDENVTFIMALEPIQATQTQIDALEVVSVPPGNVRPPQNNRPRVRWREATKKK